MAHPLFKNVFLLSLSLFITKQLNNSISHFKRHITNTINHNISEKKFPFFQKKSLFL